MKMYEAMFLLDAGNPDAEAALAPAREVLARIHAEVLVLKPWDERKLAYEIKGRKRGLYVLAYFNADPLQITPLQHEVELDERILRALVLKTEGLTPEKMNADTPASSRRGIESAPAPVPPAPVPPAPVPPAPEKPAAEAPRAAQA